MTPFDYKKEYKEFYLPPKKPALVDVPEMRFAAVRGSGDPNEEGGAYSRAVGVLYAVSFTLKMSYLGARAIEGYFPYVVPPLEGLWWMGDGSAGIDYANKSGFRWISMIRLPDFVTADDFVWAKDEAARKKKLDVSDAEFFPYHEGLCVQCMHIGSFDAEPATVAAMDAYLHDCGCLPDFDGGRMHHEIYLGDPRKTAVERRRTVIRHPVVRA